MKKRTIPEFFPQNPIDHVMSQAEVAAKMGITKQAVQQIEKRAIEKFTRRFRNLCPDTVGLIRRDPKYSYGWRDV